MPQVGIKTTRRSLWIGLGLLLFFLCGSCLVSAAPAAEAGEFLNDEEFEGFEALSEKPNVQVIPEGGKPETPTSKPTQKQSPQDAERARALVQDLTMDYIYGVVIILYGLNFLYGKSKNNAIAESWTKEVYPLIQDAFKNPGTLIKETQNQYYLIATDRPHVIGLQATLQLKKRQDLFSVLFDLIMPQQDLLTIDVLMEEKSMEPLVFAVVKAKEEKQVKKDNPDLTNFAKKVTSKRDVNLSDQLVILAEAEDLAGSILGEVSSTLNRHHSLVKLLHFTDQSDNYVKSKKMLRFVYTLPAPAHMNKITSLMRMTLTLVDHLGKMRLGRYAREIVSANRRKIETEKQKALRAQQEELLQKRKLEKKQAEAKRLESLPPEEQRKIEEKNYKKSLRKKTSKSVKVIFG